MNSEQFKKLEIISNLSFVPADKLDEISDFIEFILHKSNLKQKEPISVRGIWENKGFENIDIVKELKSIRKEIHAGLDSKKFD
ncbi:MAG: DUF2281 domain-containing protein [Candidatus Aminicenantes bacterium]|nr:DUF2281 domain-containing protein [Candidatus Aminicenantes bacterium]NIM79072.1 DUF2281 domain-containing protein [Candidatus Aminicenantes bacterium]NIN18351.1 DUF2281 domain-containing protein [Candidatus Aminicenantes bacterium]NIN42238.1 DUF2281 domain-containing protein [Candidatus Aminicenantes bacterium]NIN85004.1 DUF2281 domain-containing protein [Candidatus Aminicenantes bacterium]